MDEPSEPNAPDLLGHLERSLRSAAARNRRTLAVPGFELFLAPTEAYVLNLAVPVGDPADPTMDWDAAIAGMTAAFDREGRRPRLEFFAERHPELAAALERRGFRLEGRAPVMALAAGDFAAPAERPDGYRRLEPDDPGLEPFLRRQGVAYGNNDSGSEADEPVFLSGLRAGLEDGTAWAAGLQWSGGFVSGATLQTGGLGSAAELAGVWTQPEHQRRGLAYLVCRQLLSEYFGAGDDLAWLSAAPGAQRLYEKLGFLEVGTQLNYGLARGDSSETR